MGKFDTHTQDEIQDFTETTTLDETGQNSDENNNITITWFCRALGIFVALVISLEALSSLIRGPWPAAARASNETAQGFQRDDKGYKYPQRPYKTTLLLLVSLRGTVNIYWWGCAEAHQKRGVLGTDTSRKRGVLGTGKAQKNGDPKNWSCEKEYLSN